MKSESYFHCCQSILLVMVLCIAGCGGGASDVNQSTSHDEITEFLEENPEFADPGPTSDAAPLGLE